MQLLQACSLLRQLFNFYVIKSAAVPYRSSLSLPIQLRAVFYGRGELAMCEAPLLLYWLAHPLASWMGLGQPPRWPQNEKEKAVQAPWSSSYPPREHTLAL
ncbi:UNVERIFIED_CONTAM: hypothetical protein K2H54_045706 [Gekko kuhli]